MKQFYEDYWGKRVEQFGTEPSDAPLDRAEYIIALLREEEEPLGKVLDVGCGDGTTLFCLRQHFDFKGYGVEISEQAVNLALSRGIEAKVADACDRLPFPDGYFDTIICSDVLEHLVFPERALKEMLRVAKEKAIFIFSVPNTGVFGNRLAFLRGKSIFEKGRYSSNEHLHFWTKGSFEAFLERNGFTILKVTGRRSQSRLYRLILRKDSLLLGAMFVKAMRSQS